jgi:hypothetical protein
MTVPNWKLERYLLAELPESEMATLKALESENEEFRSQLEQLRNSNEELLVKYPYVAWRSVQHATTPQNRIMFLRLAAAFILCATVLIAVYSNETGKDTVVINEDGTRIKGLKMGLEVWRKTEDSVEKLINNSEVKAGDLLQLRYAVPEQCYGVILSVDGNGVLTPHLAEADGKATLLEAGRIIPLESAYELDDAPKFETFYLLTANREFELASIEANLLLGKLPKDLQVVQITLKKR